MSDDVGTPEPRTIGIVGVEQAKLTPETEAAARTFINLLLRARQATRVVSGRCHLGGIDLLAIEEGTRLHLATEEFPPSRLAWPAYKARNLRIVDASDEVYCVTIAEYPASYQGPWRFDRCYHCGLTTHVKSGGCWTAKQAAAAGKIAQVYVIERDYTVRAEAPRWRQPA